MLLLLLAIPSLSLLFLQNSQVQTRLSQYLAERVSENLKASISISSVNYSFFKRVQLQDVLIRDLRGDTLIYSELTKVRIKHLRRSAGIVIRDVQLENVWVNLVIDSTNKVNISYLTDEWVKPHIPPEKKGTFLIEHISMESGRFSLTNFVKPDKLAEVNFSDFHLLDIRTDVSMLGSKLDTVSMQVNHLSTREKKGYRFHRIATHLSIGKKHMIYTGVDGRVEDSELHVPLLSFNFGHWSDFSGFSRKVDLDFQSEGSRILLNDVMDFVPGKQNLTHELNLDGEISGTLNHFRGTNMEIGYAENSSMSFDFLMLGLPDFKNTFMDLTFRELRSSVPVLMELAINAPEAQLHEPWSNMGTLNFNGQFTGFPDNFVASGLMQTDQGRMVMDMSFRPGIGGSTAIRGHLHTREFQLGTLLEQEEILGRVDMNMEVDASLDQGEIHASLKGAVDTLDMMGYTYSNIDINGTLTNTTFNGGFSVDDPNLEMDFEGMMDFSSEIPDFNFRAEVNRSNPYYLELGVDDPSTSASFTIETDMSGVKVDELNGEMRLINSLFERDGALIQLYDISLLARNTPDTSSLHLSSDLFAATLQGNYRLSTLPYAMQNLADKYVDIDPDSEPELDSLNYFDLRADLYHLDPILDFFLPTIQLSDSSFIQAHYDMDGDSISATAAIPSLSIGPVNWHKIRLEAGQLRDELDIRFSSDSIMFRDAYTLEKHQFHFYSRNDSALLYTEWDNFDSPSYSGLIKVQGHFISDTAGQLGFKADVLPTDLFIKDELWAISPATVYLWPEKLQVDSFNVGTEQKHLLANGYISKDRDLDLEVELQNLNLEELASLSNAELDLNGRMTGTVALTSNGGIPLISSDLRVDTLVFNRHPVGPTTIKADWIEQSKRIQLDLRSTLLDERSVGISGSYIPESRTVDMEAHLDDFALSALAPYLKSFGSEPEGFVSLSLTIDGPIDGPTLNGNLDFNGAAISIDFLNTRYFMEDELRIFNNNVQFRNFHLYDKDHNVGTLNGALSSPDFSEFYTNIHLEMDNLLCLDTREKHNETFYGTIYTTGDLRVRGEPSNLDVQISTKTERNTALFFPLYNAREVQSNDYITFVNKEIDVIEELLPEESVLGLNLEVEVEITEDAVVQLIFDPKVGDIIETSGRGGMRLTLDQEQGLRMFGDVELIKGDYLFTLQNVINKKFEIEPGGNINFNGTLDNARIDLEAIYGTRVAPYNLYPGDPSEEASLDKRIPVECRLALQGNLRSPTISTNIEMPTADPETRDLLENATSTEEELMKQFLSLLIINNFYSVGGYGGDNMGEINSNIAGVTASELLSNQLSNWLSQINENFDVGFNYRPGDEVSSSEYELALSTQILNDRMIISGNVDYIEEGTNSPGGDAGTPYVMGDVEVEYKITHNISLLAFNRARDELIFQTAPYKQGVGISYREDFNSFGELMQRYREAIRQRNKKRDEKRAAKRAEKEKKKANEGIQSE